MAFRSFYMNMISVFLLFPVWSSYAQLSTDAYTSSCPHVFPTVRFAVQSAIAREPRMGASLLRLHFHDCFVNVSHYVFGPWIKVPWKVPPRWFFRIRFGIPTVLSKLKKLIFTLNWRKPCALIISFFSCFSNSFMFGNRDVMGLSYLTTDQVSQGRRMQFQIAIQLEGLMW